jgi:hypothetical protein
MFGRRTPSVAAAILAALLTCIVWIDAREVRADEGLSIAIQIAPSTLLLNASQGGSVTVHADIPYSEVDSTSVKLDGIAATATFADDCGDLVAKFKETEVEAGLSVGRVTLTLTGLTTDGTPFRGADTVRVSTRRAPRGNIRRG